MLLCLRDRAVSENMKTDSGERMKAFKILSLVEGKFTAKFYDRGLICCDIYGRKLIFSGIMVIGLIRWTL